MNLDGKCRLLKIYINEDSKYMNHNLYHTLVIKLKELSMAGVTVTRGIEGYGQSKKLHSARILELSANLPIIIEVIDTAEKIEEAIPVINEIVNEGIITLTDVAIIKHGKQ